MSSCGWFRRHFDKDTVKKVGPKKDIENVALFFKMQIIPQLLFSDWLKQPQEEDMKSRPRIDDTDAKNIDAFDRQGEKRK